MIQGLVQPSQEPYLPAYASGRRLSPPGMSELSLRHPPHAFEAGAEGALSPHLSVWFESSSGPQHTVQLCRALSSHLSGRTVPLGPPLPGGCHMDQMRSVCVLNQMGNFTFHFLSFCHVN